MKTMQKIIILVSINFLVCELYSQNSMELGVLYSTQLSKIVSTEKLDRGYIGKIYHSFGLDLELKSKSRLYFTSGLYYRNKGSAFDVEITTTNFPEGIGEFERHNWTLKSLDIQLTIGYTFVNKNKFIVGCELGIINSFLMKQEWQLKSEVVELEIFNDYFVGPTVRLNSGIKVNEKTLVRLIPNFSYRFNDNLVNYNLIGYGIDVGLSYKIK